MLLITAGQKGPCRSKDQEGFSRSVKQLISADKPNRDKNQASM
jgi:hypothetical protein